MLDFSVKSFVADVPVPCSEPCYNGTVQWKEHNGDVTVDKFLSRQRPKIIFSADGITPLYLTNGVLASEVGGGGMEFTVAIPFNVPENRA